MPRGLFAMLAAVLALTVAAVCYPPRLEAFTRRDPRLQEWARADGFLKQIENPMRTDVEPAMRWRLLPPVLCRALGLKGAAALTVPWAGLLALLAYLAWRIDALSGNAEAALLGAVLVAVSGNGLTISGWLGINDAWFLLALLGTTLGESALLLVACGLLGPWVDERYLIGLPLALLVRRLLPGRSAPPDLKRDLALPLAAIVPYVAYRLMRTFMVGDATATGYFSDMLSVYRYYAAYVPLGWWMGFRLGWIPLGAQWFLTGRSETGPDRHRNIWIGGAALATLTVMSVLAWDLSRSTGIILPAVVFALLSSAAQPQGLKLWRWALGGTLLLPYAHIVGPTLTWNYGPWGWWHWILP